MTETDSFNELLVDLAKRLDALQVKHYAQQGFTTLLVDEEVLLYFEIDAPRGVAVISGDVADPPAASRPARYELILQYNNIWHDTGGVRMALDGPDGTVVLVTDIAVSVLTLDTLEAATRNFTEKLRTWRELLDRPLEDEPNRLDPGDGDAFIVRA